jgi:hydrogenase maturation protease
MTESEKYMLVLGIGNELLTDAGIGPKLVKELQGIFPSGKIDYMTSLLGGMETLEIMKGYDEVLIIDGIKTDDGKAGTVYVMDFPHHKSTLHLSNAHDISFEMVVKLARRLNIPFPEKIRIIAVEIVEDRVFSEALSPSLRKCYQDIFSTVSSLIPADCYSPGNS